MLFEKFEKDFRIDVTNNQLWPNYYDVHFHDGYEMYFLFWGNINYMIKDAVCKVHENNIVWIPPNIPHKTRPRDNEHYKRILFYIKPTFIEEYFINNPDMMEFISNAHVLSPSPSDVKFFRKLANILSEEYFSEGVNSTQIIQGILISILSHLKRIHDKAQRDSSAVQISKINSSVEMRMLLSYIDNHFFEKVELATLSQQINLSPVYISSLFKKEFGFTFKEYLLNVRINAAMEMLKSTNDSVDKIALNCGFNSSNHFCKTFKKMVGMPPATFRNLNVIED